MSEVPEGWVAARLADIVQPRGEKASPQSMPDKKFLGMDDVEAHTRRIVSFKNAGDLKSSAARFYKDDVLYGRLRPYLNKVVRPPFDGLASAEFIVFSGNELIDSLFLLYRLNSSDFTSFANHLNEGDRPRVDFAQIGEFELILPPPNEQRRIVEKIENLFAELDKGEEGLRTAKARAGLYRQSLLKHAFEGHLTADWRAANPDKLEDPETLLTRIQDERDARFKQALDDWQVALEKWRDEGEDGKKPAKPKRPKVLQTPKQDIALPFGWAKVPLGMIVDEPNYGTSKKCDYDAGPVGVLRIPNISQGKIDPSDLKSAEFTKDEIGSYELETGDLLVIRSNGSVNLVGKGALVQEQHTDFLYAGYLIRLRSNAVVAVPRYVHLAMMSHAVRSQIESKAKSTSGVNNINSGELQSLVLSLCSVAEQVEVADRLDAKLSTLEAVEKQLDEQLARSKALRQSILKRAFSGELVAQDTNDEPASALLERIKAEKAEAELAAKRDRKTKPVRKPKNRRPTMTDLIEVLKKEGDWVSASKAAQGLGIADGTSSDDVEAFYRQLKERIEANEIEVERRGDEDWLRLAKVEAN